MVNRLLKKFKSSESVMFVRSISAPKVSVFFSMSKYASPKYVLHFWGFPNYIGAIDEKHIRICPKNSGSQKINYKNFFGLFRKVLLMPISNFWVFCDGGTFAAS